MADLTLYSYPISGNCYKVRLLLEMLHLPYTEVNVDLLAGYNLKPEFKQLNPRGQVPVLSDGEVTLWDSLAILVYLARRYGSDQWLPTDPVAEAQVMQWLAVSENELLYGLARSRAIVKLGRPFVLETCQAEGKAGLSVLEQHLAQRSWLVTEQPTIADLACYPYVVLAPEGNIDLAPYPAVQAWLKRVESLAGWLPMPINL